MKKLEFSSAKNQSMFSNYFKYFFVYEILRGNFFMGKVIVLLIEESMEKIRHSERKSLLINLKKKIGMLDCHLILYVWKKAV